MKESCANCRFANGLHPIQCRRFPPQVGFQNEAHWFKEHWPEVKASDWCGEWNRQLPSGDSDAK